ncbi:ABC transporter substrate-binding protein [Nocardioides sp. zg-536]|uniref:Thiamine pyrimidine synthase n=1 Tax=Nocardioides faecalis TaxID=2803858 RepID=A0A939BVE8_9ACTN|nr:ABC transporter substrate-binding protein [Nocardioides faecalis]MBM9459866.1 ABC transporter substrate-binding protein [Nocardioides faecalis]MBS4754497.1 ABC transporter substrate-binding protein [Nocardioides faecalis]QVI58896.1 ABC transporter substrate-binding protein [Nocardioides faecalis]
MNLSLRRGLAATALALAASTVLAACGSDDEGDDKTSASGCNVGNDVKLQLQWLPQAQFAGYYAALDQGYFSDEGLNVEIIPSGGDIVPQDALASGDVDYAIAWVPKVLGSIEQGAGLTNIAQIFQRSGTLQVAMADSGIDEVADFEGKKIGSWGFGNEWEIFAAMAAENLDSKSVEIVTQDFNMTAFLQGDIDAAQAMTYNEYAQLLETKNPKTGKLYTPEDFNVISYEDTDGAMLQDAIWAETKCLEDEAFADRTVKFLKAVVKGWAYARDNAEKAADITVAAGSSWGPSHELWMTNETNKLIWPAEKGIGVIDEAAWKKTVDGALSATNEQGQKLITAEPPAGAYDNTFIEKAIEELGEEVDTTGAGYKPIEVELAEGGN